MEGLKGKFHQRGRSEYESRKLEIETNDELERKIKGFSRKEKVRLPRARRQLIERGLAVTRAELPPMTEEEKRIFGEQIEELRSLIKKKEVRTNERNFT